MPGLAMRFALLLLLSACLCAQANAQTRYARLGEIDGSVEAQIHPSEPWKPASRNTPLLQSSWIRTGSASHAEIELDEGSVLRLAENSICELSDYTRLSTGQRITHISLDSGVAYFNGESSWRDALILSIPSTQLSIRRGSRVRLEAGPTSSRVSVLEGSVRFSSATVDLELAESKMLRLDLSRTDKFYLLPEIEALDSDSWSVTRDKLLAGDASRNRLPGLRYGVRDLDSHGEWIDTAEFGMAWKPSAPSGWVPFRDGKWQWYEGLGYTWISADSWGWLPYHYGRWMLQPSQGWIWTPGSRQVFKAGDVYWMRGANVVGWGPLAPGESWAGPATPTLYLKANTTFARYAPSPNLREIDPAGFMAVPKDPLTATSFSDWLPSPRLSLDRLEFVRSPERAGTIRMSPSTAPAERWVSAEPERSRPVTQSMPQPTVAASMPRRQVVEQQMAAAPAPAPAPIYETYYVAPVYTGIIIMNPPEKERPKARKRSGNQDAREEAETEKVDRQDGADQLVPRSDEARKRAR